MIQRYNAREDGVGNLTLELGNEKLKPSNEHDLLITKNGGGTTMIVPYHRTRTTGGEPMVLRLKDEKLIFRNEVVEDWQELPPEIWGGEPGKLAVILGLLAKEMGSESLRTAVKEINDKMAAYS